MKRFQKFEGEGKDLVNSTLRTVELNITTRCNRSCSFCPQSWGFKENDKRQPFVDINTVDRFIEILSDYDNQITICGQGEPTLHPQINEILNKFQILNNKIILVTNAYKLREVVPHLGKIRPRVSLYEPTELPDIDMDVIDYYSEGTNEYFNNRGYTEGLNSKCYFPSYKLFVDTNGGVLPCDNNWQDNTYLANIHENSLSKIWLDKMNSFRSNCSINRQLNDYCKNCDASGTLYGETESNLLTTTENSDILTK